MSLAHARALLADCPVCIAAHAPDRDQRALDRLAQWALRYSPVVAPDSSNGLLMDLAGTQRLFGDEGRLLRQMTLDLSRLGLGARIAAATTFGCAWAVARYGRQALSVVADECLVQVLSSLPPAALRIGPDVQKALAELGIDRIGHLLSLPRAQLVSRFGSDLIRRLDQAVGHVGETINPICPPTSISVGRVFDGPIKQSQSIQLAIQKLIQQFVDKLRACESGVVQLHLVFFRSDLVPLTLPIKLSHPNRNIKHLWSIVRSHVESSHFGFGVEEIYIIADRIQRLPHEQMQYWCDQRQEHSQSSAFGQLLDTMISRLGREHVLKCRLRESHLPERTFSYRSVMEPQNHKSVWVTPADRPSVLLRRPESIRVMALTPGGPLSWLKWRGRGCYLSSSLGPERIGGEWWFKPLDGRHAANGRDYFKVQDNRGQWLWVYRQLEDNQWFIHGHWA